MREPWVVSNELRGLIEPLIPKRQRRFRHPGRLPLEDRRVLFTEPVLPPWGDQVAETLIRWSTSEAPVADSRSPVAAARASPPCGDVPPVLSQLSVAELASIFVKFQ
jgi:hypothetical protein